MLTKRRLAALAIASPVLLGGIVKLVFFSLLATALILGKKITKPNICFVVAFFVTVLLCGLQLLSDRTDIYNSVRLLTPVAITLLAATAVPSSKQEQLKFTLVKSFLFLSIFDILFAFFSGVYKFGLPSSISTRHVYKINTLIFPDTNYAAFFVGVCFLYLLGTKWKLYKTFAFLGIVASMSVAVWITSIMAFGLYLTGRLGQLLFIPLIITLSFANLLLDVVSGSIGDVSKLIILNKSISLIAEYPILGAGIGSFDSYVRWSAHTLVSQFAELGLIGFIIPLSMMLPLIRNSLNDSNLRAILCFSVAAGILSFFPMSFIGLLSILGTKR